MAYNSELVYWAADMLAESWNTSWIKLEPELRAPFMCLVVLPQSPQLAEYQQPGGLKKLGHDISQRGAYVMVTSDGTRMFLRISAHVYNYKEEYYLMRDAISHVLGIKVQSR